MGGESKEGRMVSNPSEAPKPDATSSAEAERAMTRNGR
jgi:hypothetical protein